MIYMEISKLLAGVACCTVFEAAAGAMWISGDTAAPEKPAPVLSKGFVLDSKPGRAVFTVAVAGWCEVSVNGWKAAASLPTPTETRRKSPSRWQWCRERCRRGESQTLAKWAFRGVCPCPVPLNVNLSCLDNFAASLLFCYTP